MPQTSQLKSVLLVFSAFALWGLAPVYFKWVQQVPAVELMSHRVVWSVVFLIVFMIVFRKPFRLSSILNNKAMALKLCLSGVLIAINWSLYVWANATNQVLSTSLGYFISPLVYVLLGVIFLGESLNRRQSWALMLVALAVVNQIWQVGQVPWLALSLAFSFGFYGLIRKHLDIDSFNGLLFEVLLIGPITLAYLMWLDSNDSLVFLSLGLGMDLLILLSGVITLLPLILFASGVKGINLTTVGFIQYLAPSLSFLLAVFVFDEPFTFEILISFFMIWTALALISLDAIRRFNRGV